MKKTYTQKTILQLLKASRAVHMYPPEYIKYLKKKLPNMKWNEKKILKLKQGTCVGGFTDKKGKTFAIVIKTVYSKPYTMGYSTHAHDRHKGREIFFTNFPLKVRLKLHFK